MFGISVLHIVLVAVIGLPHCSAVLDDPATGLHWRFEPSVSGGPGKLVQTSDAVSCSGGLAGGTSEGAGRSRSRLRPVVRRGNSLMVLQESSVLRAELSAIALSDGAEGDSISVRLRFAAKVVRARITGPGRAVLVGSRSEGNR